MSLASVAPPPPPPCVCAACDPTLTVHVATVGDSQAVLCCRGRPVVLGPSHRPEAPDERARITAAGGVVLGAYVADAADAPVHKLGVSRTLGDLDFRRLGVIPDAEVVAVRVHTATGVVEGVGGAEPPEGGVPPPVGPSALDRMVAAAAAAAPPVNWSARAPAADAAAAAASPCTAGGDAATDDAAEAAADAAATTGVSLVLATDGLWDADEGATTPAVVVAALGRMRRGAAHPGWAARIEAAAGRGTLAATLAGRLVRVASKVGRPIDDCTVVVVPLG